MPGQEASASPHVDRSGIASAAAVIGLGNVISRVLGLLREMVISNRFGAQPSVSAFRIASRTYSLFYELLIGGMIASALVPVLSEYAEKDREDFSRLLGSLFLLLSALLCAIVLAAELAAPGIAALMGQGLDAELRALTAALVRLTMPALLLMGLAGLLSASLYSLKRPWYPAFMAAAFNGAVIVCGMALSTRLHIAALAVGVLMGALGQFGLQYAGVARSGIGFRWGAYHPAVRRMLALALPVLTSLVVGQVQVVIDTNLASHTGDQSIAWMANATTLIQFPLGLVATAASLGALPSLSRLALDEKHRQAFLATLAFSLRLVLILILPATALLAVLGTPLIRLLLEHGSFLPADTAATSAALKLYLIGLPFAAVDQCLILTFYARRDTLRPALVGVAAVGIYLAVALSTMGTLGMLGLVLANSVQWLGHALIMLALCRRRMGPIIGFGIGRTLAQSVLSCAAAAVVAAVALRSLPQLAASPLASELIDVAVPGILGAATYVLAMLGLHNQDLISAYSAVRRMIFPTAEVS